MRKNLLILFGLISFWSALFWAAWAYLPLFFAALTAAVHCFGLVLTTAHIFAAWGDCPGRLSLPGAVNPFDFSPHQKQARGGNPCRSVSGVGLDFAECRTREISQRSGCEVTSESDALSVSHDAKRMGETDLQKAGFTVVCGPSL